LSKTMIVKLGFVLIFAFVQKVPQLL
jgi:hypothetical protein